jgi:single-strand DNA-binding protein
MINKVFLLGNLGSDPQVKFTKDGVMMVIFRVATNEFIRRNGTYEKVTDWHTVRVFGKLAEFCSKLKKGDRVFIEGKLKSSSFEIDNKIFRVSTVIAKSVKLIPQGITKEEIDRVEIYNNEDFGIEQEEELPF